VAPVAIAAEPAPLESSVEPLDRPLHVLTMEELAWGVILLWTVVTRFFGLGLSTLSARAAARALFAYDLANGTNEAVGGLHPYSVGWAQMAQAAVFAAAGADDFTARVIQVVAGCLLVGVALASRRQIGRAGALALGLMLALSPTLAYLTRAGSDGIVADGAAMLAVVAFMRLRQLPTRGRAALLGVIAGLMLGAGTVGGVIGLALLLSAGIAGLIAALTTKHPYLAARVWLKRYGGCVDAAVFAGSAVCLAIQWAVGGPFDHIPTRLAAWPAPSMVRLGHAIDALALPAGFYEFAIVAGVVVGLVAVVLTPRGSGRGGFTLLWTVVTFALCLSLPLAVEEKVLALMPPAALLGGIGIEYLYRSSGWASIRWPLLALLILSAYVQLMINFIYPAPNPAEPPWTRHANLYWSDGATTLDLPMRAALLERQIPPLDATVFCAGEWTSVLRWYLRGFRPVQNADHARLLVLTGQDGHPSPDRVDYAERWEAQPNRLTWHHALRYLLRLEAWGALTSETATFQVRPPVVPMSNPATVVIPPPPAP
jgi:hypothetical protein